VPQAAARCTLPALFTPGFAAPAEPAESVDERHAHPKAVRVTLSQNLLRVMFFGFKEFMPSPLSNRTACRWVDRYLESAQ
jgi:hypothetical protein